MYDLRSAATAVLGIAALVLGGLLLQQQAETANERTAHAHTRAQHAQQLQRVADRAWSAADAALRAQATQQRALHAIDAERTKEKDDAQEENKRLGAAVAAGTVRLRIAATCPARPADPVELPSAAPAASVDHEAATLTAAAGQAVLDLRDALIEEHAALRVLQAYGRDVCSLAPAAVADPWPLVP